MTGPNSLPTRMSLPGVAQLGATFYVAGGLAVADGASPTYVNKVYKYDPSAENLVELEGLTVRGSQLPMLMAVKQTC